MNVRFVGGSLDGQASDIQDWAMRPTLIVCLLILLIVLGAGEP